MCVKFCLCNAVISQRTWLAAVRKFEGWRSGKYCCHGTLQSLWLQKKASFYWKGSIPLFSCFSWHAVSANWEEPKIYLYYEEALTGPLRSYVFVARKWRPKTILKLEILELEVAYSLWSIVSCVFAKAHLRILQRATLFGLVLGVLRVKFCLCNAVVSKGTWLATAGKWWKAAAWSAPLFEFGRRLVAFFLVLLDWLICLSIGFLCYS